MPTARASGPAPAIKNPDAPGRANPSLAATGAAVRAYTMTVPMITRNVSDTSRFALGNLSGGSRSAKTDEPEAATIPRGPIHARNARSRQVSPDRSEETQTHSGR